jgi:hypothetical protein
MGTYTARNRARAALVSLAEGEPDSDSFRHEAIAILHRAIGVDGWGWLMTDPGALESSSRRLHPRLRLQCR